MAPKKDPEERSRELMAEMERAIAQGEGKLRETGELFSKVGVARGAVGELLSGHRLDAEGRARAEAELASFREEIARDMSAAASPAKKSAKVKPGAMRV
ncbi:MAG: hypothetical protein U1E53_15855 [Dongiaceae bacterium]